MSGKDNKKRAQEVFERLEKLSHSPIVAAAKEFRLAGLETEVGTCYFHVGLRDFRSIELVASHTTEQKDYLLTISWHVAMAPGDSKLLVVVTGTGEQRDESETVGKFRPLTNVEGQILLPMMHQPFTGIGLLDAPRILGRCLEDSLRPNGIDSRNYQALQRALNSAYQATQATATLTDSSPLRHFKIAIPLLMSPTDLYEANISSTGVESDDSCFMGIQIGDQSMRVNQPVVDIINPDFVVTYAKMAAETVERLPQRVAQLVSDGLSGPSTGTAEPENKLGPGTGLGKPSQVDAWENFRNL